MSDKAANNADLKKQIQILAGTYNKDLLSVEIATIQTVDEGEWTCTAIPVSGIAPTEITDIQLTAELSSNGFIQIPKIGSNVILAITLRNEVYVLLCSEIEKLLFYRDNNDGTYESFTIDENGIVFGDASFGGIPINAKILLNLNSIIDYMNTQFSLIATALNGIVGGSGTPITTEISNTPTMQDTQNKAIKHGLPITP